MHNWLLRPVSVLLRVTRVLQVCCFSCFPLFTLTCPLFFQLEGHNEPVTLQVFVGNDSGRVKPHGFYQACRVMGRNTTPCKEVDIEGTTVIEVGLDPNNNMTLA